jgi:fatty-acyl-CoA synthase
VVFSGGAPLSGELAKNFIRRFGRILYNFYGSTETGINTFATSEDLLRAPGTIGRLVPGTEIRLLDDDGREVRDGEVGEVFVKNGMLIAGYHGDRGATERSMRDGFFSVGDLARVDRYGLYHIAGRKRDMIISGGVNVYPAETEVALNAHPKVDECAVLGVEDPKWGQKIVAAVVTNGEVSADELIEWCKQNAAYAAVPKEIRAVASLPRNDIGKVDKKKIASEWGGG